MKRNLKRAFALLLAVCLLAACLPLSAAAADSDFVIENGVLLKYNGSGGAVVIPDGVTRVGNDAFAHHFGITSVTFPSSLISIGYFAFHGCNLTSVTLPDGVTEIGQGGFEDCSRLTSVSIPDSVTSIGGSAFSGCTLLTSIKIPDGVTRIASSTFYKCASLTSVVIPKGVTSIGSNAFEQCTRLTSVTIPNNVTSIEGYAFAFCTRLISVTIPDSVTSIGSYAFYDCTGLTSVTIPRSVTKIYSDAFKGCNSLTIHGYTGSYAETFAKKEDIRFVPLDARFTDVAADIWYAPAVAWAVERGITVGATTTTFGSENPCLREHAVTFLWRAAGSPEPTTTTNPFTDVASDAYYYKAVLWAVEKGITRGMTATTFGPSQPCKREQIVTFLYRDVVENAK